MLETVIHLLCFPYAGASASVYMRWRRHVPNWINIVPVELPGHGRRWSEMPETDMPALIRNLESRMPSLCNRPFALFGHSLGAIVAFEYARALARRGGPQPALLFASGAQAPHCARAANETPSDEALYADLLEFRGTPADALADPELMQLVLPVLRADYTLAARYNCPPRALVDCPIHALGGRDDRVDATELHQWQAHTRLPLTVKQFPGSHFYLHEQQQELLGWVAHSLRDHSPRSALGEVRELANSRERPSYESR